MEDATLSDGAQQANMVSSDHAETMFGIDQAETNMVKLVDGKLVPMGEPEADVSDDMPRIRTGSDEERALMGDEKKKYENSEAALRAGSMFQPEAMPDDPIAVAGITGNPDAGSTVNTGLPSEDAPNDRTDTGDSATKTHGFRSGMIPPTPGTPDPMQPTPGIPETPPYNPIPGPEIPELPGSPSPDTPEIEDPTQPERQHEINSANFITFTAGTSASTYDYKQEGEAVPGNQYEGMTAGPDDEGMSASGPEDQPDTGGSARPYNVDAKSADEYQPGERPEEAKETRNMPRERMDESSTMAEGMMSGTDRSDQKSTDGIEK